MCVRVRIIFIALLIVLAFASLNAQQVETIFLVRHADRASNAPDSLLSDRGQERAECLARTLGDAGISQIYATEVRRTQQTAEPLAHKLRLRTKVVAKANTRQLLSGLRSEAGKVVLVVGHADTLPGIVEQIGGGKIAPFGEEEYDRMIILPLVGTNAGRATVVRYCEPMSASQH